MCERDRCSSDKNTHIHRLYSANFKNRRKAIRNMVFVNFFLCFVDSFKNTGHIIHIITRLTSDTKHMQKKTLIHAHRNECTHTLMLSKRYYITNFFVFSTPCPIVNPKYYFFRIHKYAYTHFFASFF